MRWTMVVMFLLLTGCNQHVSHGIDEETGLAYWQVEDGKISLRLVQRTPLQTQSFFLGRGFTRQQTETIAHGCVFQTIFKNISNESSSPVVLSYDLDQWVVHHDGKQPLKTREAWQQHWQEQGVAKAQQLAFNWALLPTRQEYRPGDYNWGMTAYDLAPGGEFDLTVRWQEAGQTREVIIHDLRCSTDIAQPNQEEES
ncbi:MAG: hypothetical protein HUJ29_03055 [Gammaproteobacteria bacterium]|nr:hypothetical protein [Gammaproteobacteria bacterium]